VLLFIGLAVYRLVGCLQPEQLPRAHAVRRGLWFALTIAAFALGDFWMFVVLAVPLLLWGRGREQNVPALFLALLFVVPPAQLDIPGMGLVNFFFSLSWPRLLALVLLLPLVPRLIRQPRQVGGDSCPAWRTACSSATSSCSSCCWGARRPSPPR
jgi:hypothetical protein